MPIENAKRLLVFVAHPDDESIGCGVLLQRIPTALAVFAVDGAPEGYGFEHKFGSLNNYSEERFKEAGCALAHAGHSSFRRLNARSGTYFPDRHLFEHLEEAADSLLTIAREFSPDAIVSHAFEGGHIDHDACTVLADHAAQTLALDRFEFPLYWKGENGHDVFQQFRDPQEEESVLNPCEAEIATKNKMLAEYKSQRDMLATFCPERERFRSARSRDYARLSWNSPYPGNWRSRRDTKIALQRFSEFRKHFTPIG